MTSFKRPSLFVGSSGKNIKAAEALRAGLSPYAEVTLWSEHPDFQVPGTLFPQILLRQPEQFDFAAMVLADDDHLVNDKGTFTVPRDNVVFELGLFMAHLGPQRTFMVVPTGEAGVKLLSDLSGMIWTSYQPPNGMDAAVAKIREGIARNGRRNVLAYDGPPSVFEFKNTLLNEAKRLWQNGEHVTVFNFALDMAATWGPMYESLARPDIRNLTWRSVMIDPDWPTFREIESETVVVDTAITNRRLIQEFCSSHKDELIARNVSFECRTYRSIPLIHGFLVNGSFLIFTLLRRDQRGRVIALDNAYLRFPGYNEISSHPIQAYLDWFNYAWETSDRWVWPPK